MKRHGILGHKLADGVTADFLIILKGAGEVTMGEDSCHGTIVMDDNASTTAGLAHLRKRVLHRVSGLDDGEGIAASHNVTHPGQESSAKGAPGMKFGEIFLGKTAGLK